MKIACHDMSNEEMGRPDRRRAWLIGAGRRAESFENVIVYNRSWDITPSKS